MPKVIFVNATAATEGGILSILIQFLENAAKYLDKSYKCYIFCSLDLSKYSSENIIIVNIDNAKKWIDRLKWDMYGLKKWSVKNNIKPDLILSLQNTGVKSFNNIKQILYIHQSLPFANEAKWSLFKRKEIKYWFYKNIYKRIIKFTVNKNTNIIVQTEWMKNAIIRDFKIDDKKISVVKPNISKINIDNVKEAALNNDKYNIFYPANGYLYKNHLILIKALSSVKEQNAEIFDKLSLHLTLNYVDSDIANYIDEDIKDKVIFHGSMSLDEVYSFYKACDLLVFPSYIETFGLPLIEGAYFGIPILAADMSYSREVIGEYDGVRFLKYSDENEWAKGIIDSYKNKTRYKSYVPNYNTSWKDFFDIIKNNA